MDSVRELLKRSGDTRKTLSDLEEAAKALELEKIAFDKLQVKNAAEVAETKGALVASQLEVARLRVELLEVRRQLGAYLPTVVDISNGSPPRDMPPPRKPRPPTPSEKAFRFETRKFY